MLDVALLNSRNHNSHSVRCIWRTTGSWTLWYMSTEERTTAAHSASVNSNANLRPRQISGKTPIIITALRISIWIWASWLEIIVNTPYLLRQLRTAAPPSILSYPIGLCLESEMKLQEWQREEVSRAQLCRTQSAMITGGAKVWVARPSTAPSDKLFTSNIINMTIWGNLDRIATIHTDSLGPMRLPCRLKIRISTEGFVTMHQTACVGALARETIRGLLTSDCGRTAIQISLDFCLVIKL